MAPAHAATREAGAALWRMVAAPETAPAPADPAAFARAAERFAFLAGPALADALLAPAFARLGLAGIDPDAVRRSRLAARFALLQQRRWLAAIVEAGIQTVCLKGFANAHTLYPDPEPRIQGDLDLLVRDSDLDRIVALFVRNGFSFRATPVHRWGMISDASFVPLVAADSSCDIDLHVRPDCYPAWRSLSTERVFAGARTIDAGGVAVRVPLPEHAFLLCVTNAAKDKFDVYSLRKAIDAFRLVGSAPPLDWTAIGRMAADGGFARPLRVFNALLVRLGVPAGRIPAEMCVPPGGAGGRTFERVVAGFLALFPQTLPLTELLLRELVLSEAGVAAHNLWQRLRGLVRPWQGFPDGISPETGLPKDSGR